MNDVPKTPNLRSERRIGDGRMENRTEGVRSRRKNGKRLDSNPNLVVDEPWKNDSRDRKHLNCFVNGSRASTPSPGVGYSMMRRVGKLGDGLGSRDCFCWGLRFDSEGGLGSSSI